MAQCPVTMPNSNVMMRHASVVMPQRAVVVLQEVPLPPVEPSRAPVLPPEANPVADEEIAAALEFQDSSAEEGDDGDTSCSRMSVRLAWPAVGV